jgi:predicted DCC family thiol-disulfide oxidoreductase YuxK
MMKSNDSILLYDGICNICNRILIFVIRHDKKKRIKFAPLKSKTAEFNVDKYNIKDISPDTIIYIKRDRIYRKSSAVLHLFKTIGGAWQLLFIFILIPGFLRNMIYDMIARNMYRISGSSDSFIAPTTDSSDRILF